MKIIFLGPQGSGKGTQAKDIAEKYNIPHISTGEAFREIAKETDDFGKKVAELINSGTFVPDDITFEVVKKRVDKDDCKNGFILDGFPRNPNQASLLDGVIEVDYVFDVEISDQEAIRRLSGRRQCKNCNTIYGTDVPSKTQGICDKCGGELYQRDDDKPDAIKKRLETYHRETEPLINHYRAKGILHEINGDQSPAKVFEDIDIILAEKK